MPAKRQPSSLGQAELFPTEIRPPDGFAYRDELISPAEERDLVARFDSLPFKPFEFRGYLGKRRVVYFGWRYDYSDRALLDSDPVPDFLLPLRDRAAGFAGLPPDSLQQILVAEYAPGAGIGWHRDRPMFGDVVALSFLAPCLLRFRRKPGDIWERASREILPRSAYLLRGPARREWEHSVPPVAHLRYSVTFRNFVPDTASPRGQRA